MAASSMVETDPNALCSWVTRTRGDVPPPLVGASLTSYRPADDSPACQVWLFGGRLIETRAMCDDLYVLNGRTWTRIEQQASDEAPSPRYFHTAQVWRDNLVIHGGMGVIADPGGGYTTELEVTNSTFLFNFNLRSWRSMPPQGPADALVPTFRYAHVAAVTADKLVVVGGQDKDVEYVQELEVLDLTSGVWVVKESMAANREQRGSYRTTACTDAAGNVLLYSNFNFTDVRRVFEVLELTPDATPAFQLTAKSSDMMVAETLVAPAPQGLRFPSASVVGDWLVWGGTYIASTLQEYCVWALNLKTLKWVSLDLGLAQTLKIGSWNRGVLDSAANAYKVFGSLDSDLLEDYQKRSTNFSHFVTLDLEAFGIYSAPRPALGAHAAKLALRSFETGLGVDFQIICEDGRRVACSRSVLEQRWPWLAKQLGEFSELARSRSFEPTAGQDVSAGSGGGSNLPTALLRNAQLHFPTEPYPVVVALVQYLYVLDLVTPVQLAPPVLSSLLLLSKAYNLPDLERRVVHLMHQKLSAQTADGIISVVGISGAKSLMVRAMRSRAAAVAAAEAISSLPSPGPGGQGGPRVNGSGTSNDGRPDGDASRLGKSRSSQGDTRPRASSNMDRQQTCARDFVFPAPPLSSPSADTARTAFDRSRSMPLSRNGASSPTPSGFSDVDVPRGAALMRGGVRQRTISEGTNSFPLPPHLVPGRGRAASLTTSIRSSTLGPPASHGMERTAASRSSQGSTPDLSMPETPSDAGSPRNTGRWPVVFPAKSQTRHRSNLSISSSISGGESEGGPSSRSIAQYVLDDSIARHAIPEVPSPHLVSPTRGEHVVRQQPPLGLAISTPTLEDSFATADLFGSDRHLSLSLSAGLSREQLEQRLARDNVLIDPTGVSHARRSSLQPPRYGLLGAAALAQGHHSSPSSRVSPSISASSSMYSLARSEGCEETLDKAQTFRYGRGAGKASPHSASRPIPVSKASKGSSYASDGSSNLEELAAVYGKYGFGGGPAFSLPKVPAAASETAKVKAPKKGRSFMGIRFKSGGSGSSSRRPSSADSDKETPLATAGPPPKASLPFPPPIYPT